MARAQVVQLICNSTLFWGWPTKEEGTEYCLQDLLKWFSGLFRHVRLCQDTRQSAQHTTWHRNVLISTILNMLVWTMRINEYLSYLHQNTHHFHFFECTLTILSSVEGPWITRKPFHIIRQGHPRENSIPLISDQCRLLRWVGASLWNHELEDAGHCAKQASHGFKMWWRVQLCPFTLGLFLQSWKRGFKNTKKQAQKCWRQ